MVQVIFVYYPHPDFILVILLLFLFLVILRVAYKALYGGHPHFLASPL